MQYVVCLVTSDWDSEGKKIKIKISEVTGAGDVEKKKKKSYACQYCSKS